MASHAGYRLETEPGQETPSPLCRVREGQSRLLGELLTEVLPLGSQQRPEPREQSLAG